MLKKGPAFIKGGLRFKFKFRYEFKGEFKFRFEFKGGCRDQN